MKNWSVYKHSKQLRLVCDLFLVSVVIKYSMVSGSSSSFVVLYVLIKSKNPLNLQSLNNQSAEINVVNVNCKV